MGGTDREPGGTNSEWCRRHQVAPHLPSLFYIPDYISPEQEAQLLREVRASKAKWVQLSGRRLQNLGGVVHAKGLIPAPLPSWLQPLMRRLAAEGGSGSGGDDGGDGGGAGGKGGGLYGGLPPNHVLVNSYMPGEGIMPHEDGPAYHPVVAILSLGAPAVIRFRRKRRPQDGDGPPAEANSGPADAPATFNGNQGAPDPMQQPQQEQQQQQQPGAGASSPSSSSPASSCPYTASVLLQPRSLVVFRQAAFTDCLHGIEEVTEELLDKSVANLAMYGLAPGTALPRGGERISLTVRRVARVMPAILRPR